jgi:hypothetical protein
MNPKTTEYTVISCCDKPVRFDRQSIESLIVTDSPVATLPARQMNVTRSETPMYHDVAERVFVWAGSWISALELLQRAEPKTRAWGQWWGEGWPAMHWAS